MRHTQTRTLSEAFCDDIIAERYRQVEKWGIQQHAWPDWLAIFTEELGEAVKILNEDKPALAHPHPGAVSNETWERARHELVQAAAVITAWVENEDHQRG